MIIEKASAFAPGHISGFFEPIFNNNDIFKTGSKGAGINISLGAKSEVIVKKSNDFNINIYLDGKKLSDSIIKTAIYYLIKDKNLDIEVKTKLDLPLSQGFGMSGASVASASFALTKILNKSYFDAIKASHYAEVIHKTGLGDVISCFFGGVEIRTKPGLPPWGSIQHIPGNYEIVLCVLDEKIDTRKILNNKNKLELISKYGNYCTGELIKSPNIKNLILYSQLFTKKTMLGSKKIFEAMKMIDDVGLASMCMLGNSVFAIGDTKNILNKLDKIGKTYICNVDELGVRKI
jgi:pantoate kinase